MDGRKFDWIHKQLGLYKAELTKQHEISHQSLYRCSWDELPRLVALAIVGLWKPGSHEVLEEPSDRKKGCLNTKRQAGHALRQKKYLKFFVENVTNRYIFAIQDSSFRSNKTMFMNSQVGLLSPEKLANSAVLAAGLSQASGSQARLWRIDRCGGERFEARDTWQELRGTSHCGSRRPGVANCDCVRRSGKLLPT